MATAQRIRFSFCVFAGLIQTLLLNGPTTNDPNCKQSLSECWSWGLTINEYYALLFVIVLVLTIPILWLKELPPPLHKLEEVSTLFNEKERVHEHRELTQNTRQGSFDGEAPPTDAPSTFQKPEDLVSLDVKTRDPQPIAHNLTFAHFFNEIWETLQNLTTLYLLTFVIGTHCFTNFNSNANVYLQYYVIKLSNLQAGIDTMTTFLALVIAIWVFQKYLIKKNWRYTQYGATTIAGLLGLVWIAPYYDAGGTMNPWFTIFIDMDTVCTACIIPSAEL